MWPELYMVVALIVAMSLLLWLGMRDPMALGHMVWHLFQTVLAMALIAWPLSYVCAVHVRVARVAIDLHRGAYYLDDHRGATGVSLSIERLDGLNGTPPIPSTKAVPAWPPVLVLAQEIWLTVQNRRKRLRHEALAQPPRPGGAGG